MTVRFLSKVVAAAVLLLVLAVGALAIFMPRLVKSDAVRERIETAARQALGREVRYAELDFGLFPPSLLVRKPAVAGATREAPPLVEAEGVALRVALLPLLFRTVVIDSLVIDGAAVRLVRTRKGIELPRSGSPPTRPSPAAAPGTGGSGGAAGGTPVDVALRSLELRKATIVLEDRTVSPAVTWEFRDVDARARGDSLDQPFAFEASVEMASGGRIAARGSATLGGRIDVELELDAFVLVPLAPYLDRASELAGSVSGTVEVKGPAARPSAVSVDVTIREGVVRIDQIGLRGLVKVEAEIAGGLDAPAGRFEIDATEAELWYGEVFAKQRGKAATMSGRILREADGKLGIDVERVRIRNLDARARVTVGERTRVVVRADPFEIRGWEESLPLLADFRLSGPLAIPELAVVTSPLDVRGSVELDGMSAHLPDHGGAIRLRGGLVADGDVIRTRNLTLLAAEQIVRVEGAIRDLGSGARYRFRVQTNDADANRLLSAFSSQRDFLYGPLNFRGDLSGALGGAGGALGSLEGGLRLDIGRGRLRGVSFLELTFARLGGVGAAALQLGQVFLRPELKRFYGDEFESISGTLEIRNGRVRTEDLRVAYPSYTADLRGEVRLHDLGLDAQGELALGPEIVSILGGSPAADRPFVVPLVAVRGTLREPDIRPDARVAAALLRAPLRRTLDRALGEGGGEALGDLVEGLLGGGSRRRP